MTASALAKRTSVFNSFFSSFGSCAAEIKKQREFYQKLGMEVPGDIKGELCNMKTHLDQRNGTLASQTRAVFRTTENLSYCFI